jgi:hypothetical protein
VTAPDAPLEGGPIDPGPIDPGPVGPGPVGPGPVGPAQRHDIAMADAGRLDVPGVGPVVESEFASVSVRLDEQGNSVRLRLEDLRTGRVCHLDALELETIIWLPDGHLSQLLDPAADRWRE